MQLKRIISAMVLSCFAIVSTVGCSRMMEGQVTSLRTHDIPVSGKNEVLINKIAAKIKEKRVSGVLANFPAEVYQVSAKQVADFSQAGGDSDESLGVELDKFYDDPVPVLTGISIEEKGTEKLEVLNAIYSEGNAEVVATKIDAVDKDAAGQFRDGLQNLSTNDPEIQKQAIAQGIIDLKTGKVNLSKIDIGLSRSKTTFSNEAVPWGSINAYYAYCATALAGEIIWALTPEWSGWNWTGWIKIIGIGITLAGIGLMYYQATEFWGIKSGFYDVKRLVSDLGGKNAAIGKISAISVATAIPVGFAAIYLQGQIDWLFGTLKSWYETCFFKPIVEYISTVDEKGNPLLKSDRLTFIKIPF